MKKPLNDEARLRHMLESIAYVDQFLTDKTKEDFYREPMLRFAIERQLEIIGETANRLSVDLKTTHAQTEWRRVVAFRNFIVHEYFGIDPELVWDIATTKLRPLRDVILTILRD